MEHDFGLKDHTVWKNGCDVSERDLLLEAVDLDAANEAIAMYRQNATVDPIPGLRFRASLIFLYQHFYRRNKEASNAVREP